MKRHRHDYEINQKLLKQLHKPTKLGTKHEGPYNIEKVHCNGNIIIKLRPNVTKCLNIHTVAPYHNSEPRMNLKVFKL